MVFQSGRGAVLSRYLDWKLDLNFQMTVVKLTFNIDSQG
jgi:hypothetical protein